MGLSVDSIFEEKKSLGFNVCLSRKKNEKISLVKFGILTLKCGVSLL